MSHDPFATLTPGLQSPPTQIEEIVPDDLVDQTRATRAINVVAAGVVRMITVDGVQSDLFIAAGIAFPVRASRVLATGTTATGIRGLC